MFQAIRAPRGDKIICKGWIQEAAMRMLMNNLDAEVAERPEDLIVWRARQGGARLECLRKYHTFAEIIGK